MKKIFGSFVETQSQNPNISSVKPLKWVLKTFGWTILFSSTSNLYLDVQLHFLGARLAVKKGFVLFSPLARSIHSSFLTSPDDTHSPMKTITLLNQIRRKFSSKLYDRTKSGQTFLTRQASSGGSRDVSMFLSSLAPVSTWIFSSIFSIHFLGYQLGEFH